MAILRNIVLLLLMSLPAWGTKYYISPTGNDATGNGSIGTPYFTMNKAFGYANAGDTIYCRGGTYTYTAVQQMNTRDGSAGNYINIWAYPSEHPIFTRSELSITGSNWPVGLIRFSGTDYIYIRDLEITGFIQDTSLASICSGLVVYNSDNCIVERVNSHHNGHGIMMYEAANAQILYCETHHNYDPIDPFGSNPYGDADGLEVTDMGQGTHTIVRGHRSWNNSDDGIDLWDSQKIVTVDSCWAWANGYQEDGETTGGDGNGIKMGRLGNGISSPDDTLRYISRNVAFSNRQAGINHNLTYCIMIITNNTSYANGSYGYFLFANGSSPHQVRDNIAYDNATGNGNWSAESVLNNNTFIASGANNLDYSVRDADFVSVDSTGVSGARTGNEKPDLDFLHLAEGSDLIDTGSGFLEDDNVIDLGAYEYVAESTPPVTVGVVFRKFGSKFLKSGNHFMK